MRLRMAGDIFSGSLLDFERKKLLEDLFEDEVEKVIKRKYEPGYGIQLGLMDSNPRQLEDLPDPFFKKPLEQLLGINLPGNEIAY